MQESATLKMFGTGQVTIPKKWREKLGTKDFVATFEDDEITINPIGSGWINLFNAERDGGPIDGRELLVALEKELKKHGPNRKVSKKSK